MFFPSYILLLVALQSLKEEHRKILKDCILRVYIYIFVSPITDIPVPARRYDPTLYTHKINNSFCSSCRC